jgi:thiol-disulfide isomerase/thioredoxin
MEDVRLNHRLPYGVAVVVAAGLLTLSACNRAPQESTAPPAEPAGDAPVLELLKEGPAFPDFAATDITGRAISSKGLRGKVVLVNFWATWCPPCRAEIPDLIKLQDKYRDKLVIIGVSEDEGGVDEVKAFVAQQRMNYPIVMTTPELSAVFRGVSALPTTFVIDREGRLAQRHVGLLNAARTELEAQVLSGMAVNVRIERVDDPAKVRLAKAAQATSIPGLDLTKLTPAQRTEAVKALNAENCTCGCGSTLAECRIDDPDCPVSLPLARDLVAKLTASH